MKLKTMTFNKYKELLSCSFRGINPSKLIIYKDNFMFSKNHDFNFVEINPVLFCVQISKVQLILKEKFGLFPEIKIEDTENPNILTEYKETTQEYELSINEVYLVFREDKRSKLSIYYTPLEIDKENKVLKCKSSIHYDQKNEIGLNILHSFRFNLILSFVERVYKITDEEYSNNSIEFKKKNGSYYPQKFSETTEDYEQNIENEMGDHFFDKYLDWN